MDGWKTPGSPRQLAGRFHEYAAFALLDRHRHPPGADHAGYTEVEAAGTRDAAARSARSPRWPLRDRDVRTHHRQRPVGRMVIAAPPETSRFRKMSHATRYCRHRLQ